MTGLLRLGMVLSLLGGMVGAANAADGLPLKPFVAHYKVFGMGMSLGEGAITLSDEGNGRYRMRSEVHPTGVTAFLIKDRIREDAVGEFQGDVPRPSEYSYEQNGGKKKRNTHLRFDWQTGQVHARYNDKQATFALEPRTVDPLSLYLLAMRDLQQQRASSQYTLINRLKLKTYQIDRQPNESVDTPLGRLQAVRVTRQSADDSRATTLWFAPALDYLPVQVVQTEDGDESFRMVLESVEGIKLNR
ncbi:MAG: DUF3108 domain-containing protein [Gammaproteobacteria bacterium]